MKCTFLIILLFMISLNSEQGIKADNVNLETDSLIVEDSTEANFGNNSSEKDSTELVVRRLKIYSGKRPSTEEKENAKELYWVIRIHYTDVIYASRMIDILRDGKKLYLPFDPVKSFDTAEEAIDYAGKNGIVDILIE